MRCRDRGEETAPIAKLDSGQILALPGSSGWCPRHGDGRSGLGDSGSPPGYAAAGTLISEVHDTKLVSRFGSLWRADLPSRTSIAFERGPATSVSRTRPGRPGRPRTAIRRVGRLSHRWLDSFSIAPS